jgi:GDPmannose 4,6-dehydratase
LTDSSERRALVTGVAGQDGSYMAEFLLAKGYSVTGVTMRDPSSPHQNLAAIRDQIDLVRVDLNDPQAVTKLIGDLQPHEIYNLAAPSVVPASWNDPIATLNFMCGNVVCLLDAIVKTAPHARMFQASSSEIFRDAEVSPQDEETAPRPTSPYGVGKVAGHDLARSFRARHDVHVSAGILYNHESPRRPVDFVTSKIVKSAVEIKLGHQEMLTLGDTSAKRDWGYAPDYVEAMWLMLQKETPEDFVIATGVAHTVQDLVVTCFDALDIDVESHLQSDPSLVRKGDEALLLGDPSKIKEMLGWEAKTSFAELLQIMIDAELAAHENETSGAVASN